MGGRDHAQLRVCQQMSKTMRKVELTLKPRYLARGIPEPRSATILPPWLQSQCIPPFASTHPGWVSVAYNQKILKHTLNQSSRKRRHTHQASALSGGPSLGAHSQGVGFRSQANETKPGNVMVLQPHRGPGVQRKGGQSCWDQHYDGGDKSHRGGDI